MLAPYAAGLLLLIVGPALLGIAFSFTEYDLVSAPQFVGFENFSKLFDDDMFRIALRNSLAFLAWSVPLRVAGALGLALLLHVRMRAGGAYRSAVILPAVMPDVAYALVWIWILNPFYGPLNLLLGAVGLPQPLWLTTPDTAQAAIIMMSVLQLGEGFVIALAARQMVPQDLQELARVEGASVWQSFRRLTLPLMMPALLLLLIRDTLFAMQGTFVPALLVTDGGPPPFSTTYLPLFIYRNAFGYLRYGYAAAATVEMAVITAAIVWLEYRLLVRWRALLNRRIRRPSGR